MNIILTGASGFVGRSLLQELHGKGYKVIAIGRKFIEKIQSPNIIYYETDILLIESNKLGELMQDSGREYLLIHAAGQAHIAQTPSNKHLFHLNNFKVTQKILKICNESNIARILFISSVAAMNNVYNDMYAETKREAEKAIIECCTANNMNYTIIRPVIIYGEKDRKGNMFKLIKQLDKGFFPLINEGRVIKNILYIGNFNSIIVKIVNSQQWHGKIIIAKDNSSLSMKEICDLLIKQLGTRCLFIPLPACFLNIIRRFLIVIQTLGLFKNINIESIRKLGIDVNYSNEEDKDLIDNLPYTTNEGLMRTAVWYKSMFRKK